MAQKVKLTKVQEEIVSFLGINLKKKTPKGWYICPCPFCDSEKFGVRLNDKGGKYNNEVSFNCFSGKCQEHGWEGQLLALFGKEHLVGQREFISSPRQKLVTMEELEMEGEDNEVIERTPPLGWQRAEYHPYLIKRGWDMWQFESYKVGITKRYRALRDYVVILIQQGGKDVGYVGRSTWNSEKIDEHNARAKEHNKTAHEDDRISSHPKYSNEGGVFFERIIWGVDEITENTETIIIVEGPFDKTNTDKQLQVNLSDKVKCICTFGKKISDSQISILQDAVRKFDKNSHKGKNKSDKSGKIPDKRLILMYDPEAIDSSKQYGAELSKVFDRVEIAKVPEGRDPGDMTRTQFDKTLAETVSPLAFFTRMVGSEIKDKKRIKFNTYNKK